MQKKGKGWTEGKVKEGEKGEMKRGESGEGGDKIGPDKVSRETDVQVGRHAKE